MMAKTLDAFDLSTASGRYQARRSGFEVPKRQPGVTSPDFWSLVRKSEGCWEFAYIGKHGYGTYKVHGKKHRAHRYAWTLEYGPIPDGLHVCHACDNTHCVRPDHLFLGTNADNVADRVRKHRYARGERSAAARLTHAQVEEIRRICVKGGRNNPFSCAALGRRFGLDGSTIRLIVNGRNWKA